MSRRLALLVIVVLIAATAAASGQGNASGRLAGTVTLKPFNPQQACKFSPFRLQKPIGPMPVGTNTLVGQCGPVTGTFTGSVKTVGASYGWNWYLQVGSNGKTTGLAGEYGALTLNEAGGKKVQIVTTGLQSPIGAQTSAHAKGLTKGTWHESGSAGSGTYTFTTERTGATFKVAKLHLTGSLGG